MAISETVLVLAGGTAVLSILFGMRVAIRALAGGAAATRSDGRQAAGGSGTPDVAGAMLAAGGFFMIAMGTRSFAAAGTNVPPTLPTTALVVGGIYRRTRNPLCLGLTLVYLGLGGAAGSLWAIGLVVPLLWVINVGVVKREERYQERKFGDAYRAYKARVRRWI